MKTISESKISGSVLFATTEINTTETMHLQRLFLVLFFFLNVSFLRGGDIVSSAQQTRP